MFFNENWPELKNKKGRESARTPTREMRPRPRPRRRPPNHSQLAFSTVAMLVLLSAMGEGDIGEGCRPYGAGDATRHLLGRNGEDGPEGHAGAQLKV